MIPVSKVVIDDEERRLVAEVLDSGHLVQGPMVERLEAGFAELAGTRHAVAVSSGTAALAIAIEALQLEPGDEVLTSPFTFVATLNAILQAGATATFTDIDAGSFVLDPAHVDDAVTTRTCVIMPVHLYGLATPMDRIARLAGEHGLAVVEDAAQAHGARIGDRAVGSFGAGCFSLYATKNVQTGEGGVITTDDDDLAERYRLLRNHGMRARYDYVMPGHNQRLSDLHAAIGLPQLARIESIICTRRTNAQRLTEGLADVPGLVTPTELPGHRHVYHQYTVRVTEEARLDRDALAAALADAGVGSGVYYPRLVWDYDCFRDHPRVRIDGTPVAAQVAREVLSLPVHAYLTDADLDTIVDAVRRALGA